MYGFTLRSGLVAGILFLTGLGAHAAAPGTLDVSGTTVGAPSAALPHFGSTPGACTLAPDAEPYDPTTFTVTPDGSYDIDVVEPISTIPDTDDTILLVYQDSFDPTDACANFVGIGNETAGSGLTVTLSAGIDYVLVVAGFFGTEDAYTVRITGPEDSTVSPGGCHASSTGPWSDAATWSGCEGPIPGDAEVVLIPTGMSVTVGAPSEVGRLAVAGALIANYALVVNEHLSNAGTLTIESGGEVRLASSAGSIATFQNDDGTISGNLTYERYYQGAEGWRLIAAPFAGVPFTSLNASFHTQGADNATHLEGGAILYGYDPTAASDARWQAITDYNQTAEPGRGYLFRMFTAWQGDTFLPGRWIIQGQESSGPLAATLPYDGGEYPELNHANFSLLGNPFAAPLDWHAIVDGATGTVGSTYYAWDPEAEIYQAYQRTGAETGSGVAGRYVAPFQGFFVFSTGESAEVTLDQSMKAIEASPVAIGRMQGASSLNSIGFELSGENLVSSRAYALIGGGSNAPLPSPLSAHYAQVGFTGDGAPRLYATVPAPEAGEAAAFEVGVRTTRPGAYTLTWPEHTLAEGWSAVMTDRVTGASVDLAAQTSYGFTLGTTSEPAQRFTISVGDVSVSTEPGSLPDVFALEAIYPNPFRSTTTIAYAVPEIGAVRIDVFDTLGRRVATLVDGDVTPGRHVAQFDAARLASGVYFVRMTGADFSATRRISVLR